jgi:eukaryotic-like serine/threonine-protein kinase
MPMLFRHSPLARESESCWKSLRVGKALCLAISALVVQGRAADWPMFRGGPALTGVASGTLPEKMVLLWSFKTGDPVKSSAAIVQGRVFIGSDNGNLYAVDLREGKEIWTFKTGGAVESSPCVFEGRVYCGSDDGFLYALESATGRLVWKYQTGEKIPGSPNVWLPSAPGQPKQNSQSSPAAKAFILVGSYDSKLHCVEAATGKSNWVYETGNYINGAPAIDEGKAVFGGCDGLLHVIRLSDGKQEKEIPAGAYIPGSPAVLGARAYFGQFENEVICADLAAGTNAWSFHDRDFAYFSSPAVTSERVVFGGRDKLLHCVQRSDGRALWSFATRGKVDSSPAICGGKVVVGSDDGRLYVVSLESGKELWSYEIGRTIESSPAVADGRIVIGCEDGNVYCFGVR